MTELEFKLESQIVRSYKRLSYKAWYAFAEFIDNSTQAFLNNEERLSAIFKKENEMLEVKIVREGSGKDEKIIIKDNSIGMNREELQKALHVGGDDNNRSGRSKYGIGMKTAAFWFGNKWSIRTKKIDEKIEYTVNLDAERIASGDVCLELKTKECDEKKHYTEICITDLNQFVRTRTISHSKNYLSSLYRFDLNGKKLKINFFGDLIESFVEPEKAKNELGEEINVSLDFTISNKKITGWASLLAEGSRAKAGFSLFQNSRMIEGYPSAYKPSLLFGDQFGGRNDLVNQRLFGLLHMDGFDVSHTKDQILISDDDSEELEKILYGKLKELRAMALQSRNTIEKIFDSSQIQELINSFKDFFEDHRLVEIIKENIVPSKAEIVEQNQNVINYAVQKIQNPIKVSIGNLLNVTVYVTENSSVYNPYVIWQPSRNSDVLIVINALHPFYQNINNEVSMKMYLINVIIDGLAEWKSIHLEQIDSETIKFLKDRMLRTQLKFN